MKKITSAIVSLILVLVLSSCADILSAGDKFFTNSWGSAFSRTFDPSNISINASNANDWVARANGNSDLAYAIAQKINQDLADGKVSDADKPAMIDAGVKLSIEASGIGVSLFTNAFNEIENLLDDEGDPVELLQNIFSNIQSDFVSNNGANVANNLAGIINGSKGGTANSPKLNADYANEASVNDIVMAVTVLTLGVFAENNLTANSDSLEDLESITGINTINENGITIDPATASPNVIALAAFYNTLAEPGRLDDDSFFSGFFDIFNP